MDKKQKDNNDKLDDFFNYENEDEINDIIKKAEQEIKEDGEKKLKPKKQKKKKKNEQEEKEMEEFRKWKEQQKLQKEKKIKNIDNNDSDDTGKKMAKKNKKNKKKQKKVEEEEEEEEEEESENSEDEDDVPEIPTKITDKIKPVDLRMVYTCWKKCNSLYIEGKDSLKEEDYDESLDYLKHAKSSFVGLNKMIQNNANSYPKEFMVIMDTKINEKLKLISEAAKKCSKQIKKENKELKKMDNNNINLNNYNYNFSNTNTNNNINSNNNTNKPKSLLDKEEDAMDQKIESEIMVKNPGVKFSDIIGMEDMKQTLYEIIVVPTIRPDLFTGVRKPQRGILIFGPPGTGKTLVAKAIASECNSTFFNISASSLTSKWVGESEKTVKSLFKIAYKKAPSIIFIDEIDSILSKRSESENEATKRLKTEFLIQFDGLGSNTSAKLLVIAATNRPMDLDEALLRRLPKRVYCGPLDEKGRFQFIKKVINRVETNLSDDDIMDIAKKTNDYSNSDLMEMCREAAYQPVRELSMEEIMKIQKFRPLVKNDLLYAVKKIRGTLSQKVKDDLRKWNEQFGGV